MILIQSSNPQSSLLALALTFHYLACLWIIVGFKQSDNEKTWFDNIAVKYDIEGEMIVDGNFDLYLNSLVHIAQTLTTVGYGSYFGFTVREYLFSMFVLLFGIIVFTFAFEKTKSIIASYNEADRREQQEVKNSRYSLLLIKIELGSRS